MSGFLPSLFGSAQKPRKRYEFTVKAEGDTYANLEGDRDANKVNVNELLQDMSAEMIITLLPKDSLMAVLSGDFAYVACARLCGMASAGDTAAQEFMIKWTAAQEESKLALNTPLAKTPDKTRALATSTGSSSGKKTAQFRSNNQDAIQVDTDQSGNDSDAEVPRNRRPKHSSCITKTKVKVILYPAYQVMYETLTDSQKKDVKFHLEVTLNDWMKTILQKDIEHARIQNSTRDWDTFESLFRNFARNANTGGRFVMLPGMISKYVETFMFKHQGFKPDEFEKLLAVISNVQEYQGRHQNLAKCHMTVEKF